MTILISLASLGGLTLLLAILLLIANKKLYVYEDPRIDRVEDFLPKANCGACGYPGCRPFAEAVVEGKVLPGKCSVSSEEGLQSIAAYLGVALGNEDKKVARLACAGGSNVAINRAHYEGMESCAAAALVSGGGKGCTWGCLGHGDCSVVCDFGAIEMDAHSLPVVNEAKCTACGDCVEACPKDLFSIEPVKNRLWVACKSLEHGDEVLENCEVGCTACGKCAMDHAGNVITVENNLPVIDYSAGILEKTAIERCATGSIVWYDDLAGIVKGEEAKKVIRVGEKMVGVS